MDKPTHWEHFCENKIVLIAWGEICPHCCINFAVESLRHQGYPISAPKKLGIFSKLFAPRKKIKKVQSKKQNYEYQDDYYDRHG